MRRKFSAFEKEWMRTFAGDISEEKIERFVVQTGNYIWHVFSWKLLPEDSYLVGDAARAAFDAEDKTGAVYMEPFEKKKTALHLPPEQLTAALLDERVECYVMAAGGAWSYIVTHEGDPLGPYFIKKQ